MQSLGFGSLPSIFEETVFSRKVSLLDSNYIKSMHPKTEIRPRRDVIERILKLGWVGQVKIHGHRAQIHLSSSSYIEPLVFNRQGKLHKKTLEAPMIEELRRLFQPEKDWNVIDAEWVKSKKQIYVFDFLKKEGVTLNRLNYGERWKLLPRAYLSPYFKTLPILETVDQCLRVLERGGDDIEGIVLKSKVTPGFEDTSVVRCVRK